MDTGIQAAALIVIISFAIDRISGGVFFLLSMAGVWSTETPGAQNRAKLAYYVFAGILAAVFIFTFKISMLAALKIGSEDMYLKPLDIAFGILVLMCGSDQVATLLKSPHAGKAPDTRPAEKPIEVTGKLTLVEQAGQRAARD
jgi:hypothetical protein